MNLALETFRSRDLTPLLTATESFAVILDGLIEDRPWGYRYDSSHLPVPERRKERSRAKGRSAAAIDTAYTLKMDASFAQRRSKQNYG